MKSFTSRIDPKTSIRSEGMAAHAPMYYYYYYFTCSMKKLVKVTVSFVGLFRLSLGAEGSSFEQQASSAVLDLMGDESNSLNQHKSLMKW